MKVLGLLHQLLTSNLKTYLSLPERKNGVFQKWKTKMKQYYLPRQTPAPLTLTYPGCPVAPVALIGSNPGASPFDLSGCLSIIKEPGNKNQKQCLETETEQCALSWMQATVKLHIKRKRKVKLFIVISD